MGNKGRGPDKVPRKNSNREGTPGKAEVTGKRVPQKKAALVHLTEGKSPLDVATALGVTDRTIQRWLKEPGFSAELAARQTEVREEAMRAIGFALADAARQMIKLGKDAGKEDMAKVKANAEVLDRGGIIKRQIIEHVSADEMDGMSDEELQRIDEMRAEEVMRQKGWRPPEATPKAEPEGEPA